MSTMLPPELLRSKFDAGLTYAEYVASGTPAQQDAWNTFERGAALTPEESSLIASFQREVNALVVSGVWCGDCVQQVPFLAHIERANPGRVRVRYVDRDANPDLAERVMICAGLRVPAVILMNEDFDFLALVCDRTLSRYRAMAKRNLGASCPLPGAPVEDREVAQTRRDWVDEFERAHLICRLSTKLRARHED